MNLLNITIQKKILIPITNAIEGQKHLHVMYVPAVPDTKHEGFKFRLCSDELTRRSVLKQWHPKYQKWLDDAGIKATVYSGKTSGKGISVKSLKEISKTTGLSLDQIQKACISNQKYMPFIIPISITFCMLCIYQETENFRKSLDFSHAEGK